MTTDPPTRATVLDGLQQMDDELCRLFPRSAEQKQAWILVDQQKVRNAIRYIKSSTEAHMNPTTAAITDRLALVLDTMERGDTDELAQLVWRAAITDAITHIRAQDNHIAFLEHMRTILHEGAAT